MLFFVFFPLQNSTKERRKTNTILNWLKEIESSYVIKIVYLKGCNFIHEFKITHLDDTKTLDVS